MFFATLIAAPILMALVAGAWTAWRSVPWVLAGLCVALGIAGATISAFNPDGRAETISFSLVAGLVCGALVWAGYGAGRLTHRGAGAFAALLAAMVFCGAAATSALAAGPVHDVLTLSDAGTEPAGTVCDFDYEFEYEATINQHRFFDENGVLVRRLRRLEEHIVHRNGETGFTLVETVHWTNDLDVVSGVVRISGNSWQLRTPDGTVVLVLSGFELVVRATGEVLRSTPMVGHGFEQVICPALGGAPA